MLDALNTMNKRLENRLPKVGHKDFDQTQHTNFNNLFNVHINNSMLNY